MYFLLPTGIGSYALIPLTLRGHISTSWASSFDNFHLPLSNCNNFNKSQLCLPVANAINILQACIYKSAKVGPFLKSFVAMSVV